MNSQLKSGLSKTALLKLAAVALLTPTVLLTACESPESASSEAASEMASTDEYETLEASNVTLDEIATDVEQYIGQEVTVRGEIEETIQEGVFLLDEEAWFGGEDVLVMNFDEPELLPADAPEVQVTGTVTQFVLADIEREYGIDLDPELYVDYETKPAIMAQSLALAPDPGEISEDPVAYYNRRIAVEGEIEEVYAMGGFTIDEEELFGGEDLVVLPDSMENVVEGERVTVTGTLRPYVKAEFDRDYDLQWDLSLQEKLEVEYENKPVFVADTVYPSAK